MNRHNQLVVFFTALGTVSGMVAQEQPLVDPCIEAYRRCIDAQSADMAKQSFWHGMCATAKGYLNNAKEYIQNIDTTKIEASLKGFSTSCMEAIEKDPKQAGIYAAVAVISSYIVYKLLKKTAKKRK